MGAAAIAARPGALVNRSSPPPAVSIQDPVAGVTEKQGAAMSHTGPAVAVLVDGPANTFAYAMARPGAGPILVTAVSGQTDRDGRAPPSPPEPAPPSWSHTPPDRGRGHLPLPGDHLNIEPLVVDIRASLHSTSLEVRYRSRGAQLNAGCNNRDYVDYLIGLTRGPTGHCPACGCCQAHPESQRERSRRVSAVAQGRVSTHA